MIAAARIQYSLRLLGGGLCCLLHALPPAVRARGRIEVQVRYLGAQAQGRYKEFWRNPRGAAHRHPVGAAGNGPRTVVTREDKTPPARSQLLGRKENAAI
jgi:hypothetical protein